MSCTPTPAPRPDSYFMRVADWLHHYNGASLWEQHEAVASVADGSTQLTTHEGARIECRELWPGFLFALLPGEGAPPPPPPPPPAPPVLVNGNLIRAIGTPYAYVYWNGTRYGIATWELFWALFGADALARVRDLADYQVDAIPRGPDIASQADWDRIRGVPPPPPPPPVCTPTPTERVESTRIDVSRFLSLLAHVPQEEAEDALTAVAEGDTILTREGAPIACREDWPAVVRSWADNYVPEPLVEPLEDETDEEAIAAQITIEQAWDALHVGLLNNPRDLAGAFTLAITKMRRPS